jgi:two-component system, NtrC family, nitrogen regulation sensor histidine kinase NtrY
MQRRFYFLVVMRIILLTATLFAFAFILGKSDLLVNHFILASIIIAQVIELIRFVNHTNMDLIRLFNSLENSDFAVTFPSQFREKSFRELEQSVNRIIEVYKKVKIEKEAQFHLLQTIMNQVNIGILAIQDDNILLINPASEKLLGLKGVRNWKLVNELSPEFFSVVERLGTGGRKLIEFKGLDYNRILSIEVLSTNLLEKKHRIIIVQDINNEIEQKEFEAWNKLIRILTHEIMNSVTPISSLTETTRTFLEDGDGKAKKVEQLSNEIISDILFSLKTIQKRSDGMLDFADTYRQFSRVPTPVLSIVNMKELVDGVGRLMHEELIKNNVQLNISIPPNLPNLSIDPNLIEQVIINLITNSIHALKAQPNPTIEIKAWIDTPRCIVEVHDNGIGIPEKELQNIFIPFYSTRKEGSGIGLSLSKQIMSLHGGTIKVKSIPNSGTVFYLSFRT